MNEVQGLRVNGEVYCFLCEPGAIQSEEVFNENEVCVERGFTLKERNEEE